MLNLGLSAADKRAFEATLVRSHRIRTTAHIHNSNEKIIHTFQGSVLSGAVQVDATQTPSKLGFARGSGTGGSGAVRTLDLEVLLPRKDPAWLPDTPSTSAAFANNFISVEYGVYVEDLTNGPDWVDVPVFWGPITGLQKDGDQVSIHGEGKEVLAMDPVLLWHPLTVRKGERRTAAIRRVLEAMGERRFDIPNFSSKMTNKWSLGRHSQAWPMASSIARYGNWQLYYDGRGRARVRPYPRNRVWLFKPGDGGSLLSKPKIGYDVGSVRNVVEGLGTHPKSQKKKFRSESRPPTWHPLSPWSLGRNGVRRNMVHVEDGLEVNSQRELDGITDRMLNDMLGVGQTFEFDSLVIPHLEEGDRVAVLAGQTYATGPARILEGQHFEFNLMKFTIPLVSGESMSVGHNRRVSFRRRGRAPVRWTR